MALHYLLLMQWGSVGEVLLAALQRTQYAAGMGVMTDIGLHGFQLQATNCNTGTKAAVCVHTDTVHMTCLLVSGIGNQPFMHVSTPDSPSLTACPTCSEGEWWGGVSGDRAGEATLWLPTWLYAWGGQAAALHLRARLVRRLIRGWGGQVTQ